MRPHHPSSLPQFPAPLPLLWTIQHDIGLGHAAYLGSYLTMPLMGQAWSRQQVVPVWGQTNILGWRLGDCSQLCLIPFTLLPVDSKFPSGVAVPLPHPLPQNPLPPPHPDSPPTYLPQSPIWTPSLPHAYPTLPQLIGFPGTDGTGWDGRTWACLIVITPKFIAPACRPLLDYPDRLPHSCYYPFCWSRQAKQTGLGVGRTVVGSPPQATAITATCQLLTFVVPLQFPTCHHHLPSPTLCPPRPVIGSVTLVSNCSLPPHRFPDRSPPPPACPTGPPAIVPLPTYH